MDIRNLSQLAYAQGFTMWRYNATDAKLADVLAPGFLSPVHGILQDGDMVIVSARNGVGQYYAAVGMGAVDLIPLQGRGDDA